MPYNLLEIEHLKITWQIWKLDFHPFPCFAITTGFCFVSVCVWLVAVVIAAVMVCWFNGFHELTLLSLYSFKLVVTEVSA